MATSVHKTIQSDNDAVAAIERLRAEIGELRTQMRATDTWFSAIAAVGKSTGEPEVHFTSDDLKEVLREALNRIYSDGLDAPDAHLAYVRGQLSAAVA